MANAQSRDDVKNQQAVGSATGQDSLKKKEPLDAVVHSRAENIRNDIPRRMSFLTTKAAVTYRDMQVEADYISIDWNTGNIFARGKTDAEGRLQEPVVTMQGGKKYETDQFSFNFKTMQAIAYNARTEESEGVIVAQKTKKVNDSVYFMRRGMYTTDEYFIKKKDSVADYHLLAPDIKLIRGKNASQVITGPVQMYIEQVPTPLIMPFAILPITDKRSAGILIPSFGERQDMGFFLNGLGYYQPLGDHFDVKLLADLYTKGSWNLRPEVNYKKNYRYSGNFSAEAGTTVRGIRGLADYSKSGTYRIGWRHQQDPKANPYLNFSASVDIVSQKFYNNTVNNNYFFNQNALNTQQNSSVSITKRFLTLPLYITGSASYSQNFATNFVNLRLPQLTVAVNQFYLFKPKNGGAREGLLENLTVNTGLNFSNYVNAQSQEMFTKGMWDKMQTGAQNNLALSTNTTLARYFTLSLSANANNVLSTKTLSRAYDPVKNEIVNNYRNKIAGFSTFSTSASLQTTLYGLLNFKKSSAVQAIRHMMTPSIGFTYSPDFGSPSWGYYRHYYDASGAMTPYSIFEGGVYGAPASGLVQSLGFNIGNNIEMKVRSKSDSAGVKKVKIFESLNISGGYNFAAKDYKWSMINVSGQTSLFDSRLSVNTSLVVDPYKTNYDEYGIGTRTTRFGGFGIQGFNVQMSVPLSDAIFGEREKPESRYQTRGAIRNENYFFDEENYARFSQPWTLNINANYAYYRSSTRFGNEVASVGLDGSVKLTPYWNINYSTNYDLASGKIGYTRLGFNRDQRSFLITFNWVPFGAYKVYDFFIGIKANILRDAVKYKQRSFNDANAPF